jgi:hypothetical protein
MGDLVLLLRGSSVEAMAAARGESLSELLEAAEKDPVLHALADANLPPPDRPNMQLADAKRVLRELPTANELDTAPSRWFVRVVTRFDMVLFALSCDELKEPFVDGLAVKGVLLFATESPVGHRLNIFVMQEFRDGCSFLTLDALEHALTTESSTQAFPVYSVQLGATPTAV